MRPGPFIHKFLKEKPADDGPRFAPALADVLDIRDLAFHIRLVFFLKRQLPKFFTGALSSFFERAKEFRGIGHNGGHPVSQRHHASPGQGRNINHHIRFFGTRIRERIR